MFILQFQVTVTLHKPRGYTLAFFERGFSSVSPACVLVVSEMMIFFVVFFFVESHSEHLSDMFVLILSRFAVCCW